ncbi:MAG TPA: helix-turn-helix transcriptional regulator [Xanthobacteraceae bacterium]|jgi:transcriptional regulator with XRE-family HTH domain
MPNEDAELLAMQPEAHPLRLYRARERLTQEQLAGLTGVEGVTIDRWEAGKRRINRYQLPKSRS